MSCRQCQGDLEPIQRGGGMAFYFCRACKLPHDESGSPVFESPMLTPGYNPLRIARDAVSTAHPDMNPVGQNALEVALIASLNEAYLAGLKDGVLLAYSADAKK